MTIDSDSFTVDLEQGMAKMALSPGLRAAAAAREPTRVSRRRPAPDPAQSLANRRMAA